jgi:hypothetical protein
MRIEQTHRLTKEEVKKRGDALADSLTAMPLPDELEIGDIAREWHDDQMDFSFRVSQGFFGTEIRGLILVTETNVVLEIKVPPFLASFIDVEKIQGKIKNKMTEILT